MGDRKNNPPEGWQTHISAVGDKWNVTYVTFWFPLSGLPQIKRRIYKLWSLALEEWCRTTTALYTQI